MSIAEIEKTKSDLIQWIEGLKDTNMLTMLDGVRESNTREDDWDALPDSWKHHILEGVRQAENGEVVSSEEFWRRIKLADNSYEKP